MKAEFIPRYDVQRCGIITADDVSRICDQRLLAADFLSSSTQPSRTRHAAKVTRMAIETIREELMGLL